MNQWFKLYGIEMLSDPKYQRLNAGERSCWLTLLCLASMDNGVVSNCDEGYLIQASGIDPNDFMKYNGILMKFELLRMVALQRNGGAVTGIKIVNWEKRQSTYSESRDRVRKWREIRKLRQLNTVTPVTLQSNRRIEQKRIEKNRTEEKNSGLSPLEIQKGKNALKNIYKFPNEHLEDDIRR